MYKKLLCLMLLGPAFLMEVDAGKRTSEALEIPEGSHSPKRQIVEREEGGDSSLDADFIKECLWSVPEISPREEAQFFMREANQSYKSHDFEGAAQNYARAIDALDETGESIFQGRNRALGLARMAAIFRKSSEGRLRAIPLFTEAIHTREPDLGGFSLSTHERFKAIELLLKLHYALDDKTTILEICQHHLHERDEVGSPTFHPKQLAFFQKVIDRIQGVPRTLNPMHIHTADPFTAPKETPKPEVLYKIVTRGGKKTRVPLKKVQRKKKFS